MKGHAIDKDIEQGNSTIAHPSGNNNADALATAGSRRITLPELLLKGHLLKRHIVIAMQAMYLACYTRRQIRRHELNLETA